MTSGARLSRCLPLALGGSALAEVSDKINLPSTMYLAAFCLGLLFALLIRLAIRRSWRLAFNLFLAYTIIVLLWNITSYQADADIRGAILDEQGSIYYWHQCFSVFLTLAIAGGTLLFKSKRRER